MQLNCRIGVFVMHTSWSRGDEQRKENTCGNYGIKFRCLFKKLETTNFFAFGKSGNLGDSWGWDGWGLVSPVAFVDLEGTFTLGVGGFLDALRDEFFQAFVLNAGLDGQFLDDGVLLGLTISVDESRFFEEAVDEALEKSHKFKTNSKVSKNRTYLCLLIANREISELKLLGNFGIDANFLDASGDGLFSLCLRFFDLLGKIGSQSLKIDLCHRNSRFLSQKSYIDANECSQSEHGDENFHFGRRTFAFNTSWTRELEELMNV